MDWMGDHPTPASQKARLGVAVWLLAAVKAALHLAMPSAYGPFVDELYFFACGEHLDFGYVDMPPLTGLHAWLARSLFGDWLPGLHLFPALMGVGLLSTTARRLLWNRWLLLAGLIAFLVFLPNLIWEIRHHFPHLEQLANIRRNGRNVEVGVFGFLWQQVLGMHPLALPVWAGGLLWTLFGRDGRPYRFLGVAWLAVLALPRRAEEDRHLRKRLRGGRRDRLLRPRTRVARGDRRPPHVLAVGTAQFTLFLCREPKGWTFREIWPRLKQWN